MERTCLLTGSSVPIAIMVRLVSLTESNSFQTALCRSALLCVVDILMVLICYLCIVLSGGSDLALQKIKNRENWAILQADTCFLFSIFDLQN